ncbi:MAG TPA: phenylalanine--tRNA ligase subunit beta, partial [Phycisphaerales bacterium]|nr:phenylalanine--tRNA ligase subunit beta [Phycisphaerales bacterium]
MKTSVRWMNDYLEPSASAEEQAEILTQVGFPMESREDVTGLREAKSDVRQDIELTSNRGDCLCHIGLAREIAAASGRTLKLPAVRLKAGGGQASEIVRVKNENQSRCALYTARVIKGVKVGPSPAWLADRLTARGDHPRNNVVDAANFVLFEYGLPTHVFDMAKLARANDGRVEIQIRTARAGETILPLGEGATDVKLTTDDLVIADAKGPIAIAGVKGGALSAVGNETKDIVIEAATFAAPGVRATSRRLGILSDASYRYERGVSAGIVKQAAERLAALIVDIAGGHLLEGSVEDGAAIGERRRVSMRCARCRAIMGIDVPDAKMMDGLARLGFEPTLKDGVISCVVPWERLDIEREIDLIEEVARMTGMDAIGVDEVIEVRAPAVQGEVAGKRAVNDALAGMGYVECVTHSLVSEKSAKAFLPTGMELLQVEDERAAAEPVLRPSVVPSLLRVYVHNRNQGVDNVRLFETASVFALQGGKHVERVNLAMVHPLDKTTGARE